MKNFILTASLIALVSFAVKADLNYTSADLITIACDHCSKDHTCDEKCKKGEKSACCKKMKAENTEASSKCCKKGEKSCKKSKAKGKEKKEDKQS